VHTQRATNGSLLRSLEMLEIERVSRSSFGLLYEPCDARTWETMTHQMNKTWSNAHEKRLRKEPNMPLGIHAAMSLSSVLKLSLNSACQPKNES
jgi:hypothetical protein